MADLLILLISLSWWVSTLFLTSPCVLHPHKKGVLSRGEWPSSISRPSFPSRLKELLYFPLVYTKQSIKVHLSMDFPYSCLKIVSFYIRTKSNCYTNLSRHINISVQELNIGTMITTVVGCIKTKSNLIGQWKEKIS